MLGWNNSRDKCWSEKLYYSDRATQIRPGAVMSESMGYILSAASNPTGTAALEQMSLETREEREKSHTRKHTS